MIDVKRTISSLGFDEFPDEVAGLLEMADSLIRAIPWLFIEQDIRY
jgi:hypothetical protein